MKIVIALITSLLLMIVCMVVPMRAANPLLAVSISGPDTIQRGKPIKIIIVLTNISKVPVLIPMQMAPDEAERSFKINVLGQDGALRPKTAYALALDRELVGSFASETIAPNRSYEQSSIVNKIYDMNAPGEYVVQVKDYDPSGVIITSNKLTVTVTQ